MAWRLAKSLERLRAQANATYPARSKASDGTIGDAAHASRDSDHNPWIKDGGTGVVSGMDLTHDPANGLDIQKLADALVASKDPRIKYIICNGRIVSGSGQKQPAWVWRPYSGSNKHNKHIHISVKASKQFYDDAKDWNLLALPQTEQIVLKKGATGKYVEDLQVNLAVLGYKPGSVDGKFGGQTEEAVKAFQRDNKLTVDGWAGSRTLTAIGEALKHKETVPKIAAAKSEATKAESQAKQGSNAAAFLSAAGGVGGVAALFQGFDWQTVAVLLGGGAAFLLLFLLLRRWLIPAIKDVKEQLS